MIDREVPLREAREVTHDLWLGELRNAVDVFPHALGAEHLGGIHGRHLWIVERHRRAPGARSLEQEWLLELEPGRARRAHAASSRTRRSMSSRRFISVVQTRS